MTRLQLDAVSLRAGSRTLIGSLTQGIGAGKMTLISVLDTVLLNRFPHLTGWG